MRNLPSIALRPPVTGPSQIWSWDITKLRGPGKGDWYHLYVLIDIYSRYVVGWTLAAREDSLIAEELIRETNGVVPHTVHADRAPRWPPNPSPSS